MGFYYRWVVDENGTFFKEFPIARYECIGRGKRKVEHVTFSVLPDQLIPYCRYSIDFIFKTISYWKGKEHSINETLDFSIDELKTYITTGQLYKFAELLELAIEKIIVCNIEEGIKFAGITDKKQRLIKFIKYSENYCYYKFDEEIRGPPALNIDFYATGGGYIKNAQFLFGTPSQFR